MKSTFIINPSLNKKIESLNTKALGGVKGVLENMAKSAVDFSPVDTGAYVTSFSYTVGAGRPRGKDSANRPTATAPEGQMAEGLDNLMQDISRINKIEDLDDIQLRNGSPHAEDVEYGEDWRREGYFVFAKLENIYG